MPSILRFGARLRQPLAERRVFRELFDRRIVDPARHPAAAASEPEPRDQQQNDRTRDDAFEHAATISPPTRASYAPYAPHAGERAAWAPRPAMTFLAARGRGALMLNAGPPRARGRIPPPAP